MDDLHLEKVRAYLEGTCNSLDIALERFDIALEVEDLEDMLLDLGIERCPDCGWWMESSELVDEDSEVVGCDQCRGTVEVI